MRTFLATLLISTEVTIAVKNSPPVEKQFCNNKLPLSSMSCFGGYSFSRFMMKATVVDMYQARKSYCIIHDDR